MLGLPTWMLIFPVLGFLIFIHELGHFVTAKWFGIKVTEFGFGFPPRIFGVPYRGTLYSINWIPLGGFVRMVGEEDPSDPDSFARQSVAKRAVVLVAGSFMNLVLPVVIFTVLFMLPHGQLVGGSVVVTGVVPGSPAYEAGLRAGDAILSVDGQRVVSPNEPVEQNLTRLVALIKAHRGRPTELAIRRGATSGLGLSAENMVFDTVTVVPRLSVPPKQKVVEVVTDPTAVEVNISSGSGLTLNPDGSFSFGRDGPQTTKVGRTQISLEAARLYNSNLKVGDTLSQTYIGVGLGVTNTRVEKTTDPFWVAVPKSFETIWDVLVFTWNGISEGVSTRSNPGIAGPVGIAQVTGEVVDRFGISLIFQLTALLSISLGIINILPIPALDGGRLMFVAIEWARRGKRISPKREGLVHLVGFAVLIAFILVLSYSDITRILNGESFF